MPVHRATEGARRSHVFAYADELDAWFRETFPASNGDFPAPGDSDPRSAFRSAAGWRGKAGLLIAGAVLIIAVGAFLSFRAIRGNKSASSDTAQPANFHTYGNSLAIVDQEGKELWRRDVKVEGLIAESEYRAHFQVVQKSDQTNNLPWLVFKDIDGDGNKEVLFAVKRRTDSIGEGLLICFGSGGREKWRFQAGREVAYERKSFSADYRIYGFTLRDINHDGREEVFTVAYQAPWEPCQLAVLDCQGQMIGEFWNAGQLKDIVFADLDGTGREEMFVVGLNNEYKGGCLIVFDPSDMRGASPQGEDYRFVGIEEGSEKFYINFPRSDVDVATGWALSGNGFLNVKSNKRIEVCTECGFFYEFDAALRCVGAWPGNSFIAAHNEFAAQGKIQSTLGDAYCEALRNGIRYWNGTVWVREPPMNLKRGVSSR